ncbi:LysR family transcriptional regulator ArgP [Aliikangiella sp. IMCC44359]|uniref:LysR family transcriptional regulator ArgP n=1 Tax=Aliikangiella sp. IMCC44359 TaxID=3459125 RepID=UPI00403B2A24
MNRIDYKLLHALYVVIQAQNFEQAASHLHISQSAISQRIKLLEEMIGHPVLIRSKPLTPTTIGERLIAHYQQVNQLEQDLLPQILPDTPTQPTKLSIAVNADSLATWFFDALSPLLTDNLIELNLLVTNEAYTIDKVKSGEAYGAVSTQSKALPGYQAQKLGEMRYIAVASKTFQKHFFAKGVNKKSLKQAPGVAFDHQDDMHHQFIEKHYHLKPGDYPCHVVHSSEAFVDMAKKDLAYCLIPELQFTQELVKNQLVNILPEKQVIEKLYWHSWLLSKGIFRQATKLIVNHARQTLD